MVSCILILIFADIFQITRSETNYINVPPVENLHWGRLPDKPTGAAGHSIIFGRRLCWQSDSVTDTWTTFAKICHRLLCERGVLAGCKHCSNWATYHIPMEHFLFSITALYMMICNYIFLTVCLVPFLWLNCPEYIFSSQMHHCSGMPVAPQEHYHDSSGVGIAGWSDRAYFVCVQVKCPEVAFLHLAAGSVFGSRNSPGAFKLQSAFLIHTSTLISETAATGVSITAPWKGRVTCSEKTSNVQMRCLFRQSPELALSFSPMCSNPAIATWILEDGNSEIMWQMKCKLISVL